MDTINPINNWLGQRMSSLSDEELRMLFADIASFRRTGLLCGDSAMRTLDREFAAEINNDDSHIRIIEDELLYEMGRRFYNSGTKKATE